MVAYKPKARMSKKKLNNLIFYICLVAIPFTQFCIFYVGVNFNSILMAFQKYDKGVYTFNGTANFQRVWKNLTDASGQLIIAFKNSFILYVVGLVIGLALALLFSFYIYKQKPMSNFFKVMLFLPSIISAMVLVLVFKYFANDAIPEFWFVLFGKRIEGLLAFSDRLFGVHIFYSIWVGFGTSILMYVGAMGNISESIVESAHIEGVSLIQEFKHITIPMIFPTMTTFVVVGVAGLFTNQMHLFSFYGVGTPPTLQTLGYFLYKELIGEGSVSRYPDLAAMGIIFTAVAAPVTLFVKWLMEKFGPSTE